jgi:hypothetical protein
VRAILDLTGLSAGEHTLDIQVQVALSPAQIVLANPSTVTVHLESLAQDPAHHLSLTGQPAAGYQAGEATLNTGSGDLRTRVHREGSHAGARTRQSGWRA